MTNEDYMMSDDDRREEYYAYLEYLEWKHRIVDGTNPIDNDDEYVKWETGL